MASFALVPRALACLLFLVLCCGAEGEALFGVAATYRDSGTTNINVYGFGSCSAGSLSSCDLYTSSTCYGAHSYCGDQNVDYNNEIACYYSCRADLCTHDSDLSVRCFNTPSPPPEPIAPPYPEPPAHPPPLPSPSPPPAPRKLFIPPPYMNPRAAPSSPPTQPIEPLLPPVFPPQAAPSTDHMNVRISGGTNLEGRVEIYHPDYGWGTVCAYNGYWESFAKAVCHTLGFSGGQALYDVAATYASSGINNIVVWDFDSCFGPSLSSCSLYIGNTCYGAQSYCGSYSYLSSWYYKNCYYSCMVQACTHDHDLSIRCSTPPSTPPSLSLLPPPSLQSPLSPPNPPLSISVIMQAQVAVESSSGDNPSQGKAAGIAIGTSIAATVASAGIVYLCKKKLGAIVKKCWARWKPAEKVEAVKTQHNNILFSPSAP